MNEIINQFQKYTNVFTDNIELQKAYLKSAKEIVEDYLGYKLKKGKYISVLNGNGTEVLQLLAKPIIQILSVEINENEIDLDEVYTINEYLYLKNGIFPMGRITVEYIAGYNINFSDNENEGNNPDFGSIIDGGNADNIDENIEIDGNDNGTDKIKFDLPNIILMTIFRIASLLQSESDSNIGVTSKSFGDSGNRTFVNTVNFDKYLIQLAKYRIMRI